MATKYQLGRAAWVILIEWALAGKADTYQAMARQLGYSRAARRPTLLALDMIFEFCNENHYPPLSGLVINKATRLPGKGFTDLFPDVEKAQREVWDYAERWLEIPTPWSEVDLAGRNPDWSRDELILALDLYMRHRRQPPGKQSPEIAGLSATLNKVAGLTQGRDSTFRNPNGVYMKLMNYRSLDPEYTNSGKVGLPKGGSGAPIVWRDFSCDQPRLHAVAEAILASVNAGEILPFTPEDEEEEPEVEEGRWLTRVHRSRERKQSIVNQKKQVVMKRSGLLACEVCEFVYKLAYGERGEAFIEAHHVKPLHTLVPGQKTRLEDLALICANCHRMIHAKRPWLSVEELRALIKSHRPAVL